MKLHGAIQLGSTSVLLNNIDKYVKRGQIWPWKRTFRAIQANPPFWQFTSTLPGKLYAKIEKSYWTVLEQMASKCKKSQIWPCRPWKMTFRAIQPNLPSYVIYVTPKKLHAKKEEKLLKRFWDRPLPPPPSILLDRQRDDGQISIRKAPLPFGWRS